MAKCSRRVRMNIFLKIHTLLQQRCRKKETGQIGVNKTIELHSGAVIIRETVSTAVK